MMKNERTTTRYAAMPALEQDLVGRVRLADIDAPERGQPYASKSKRELSRLCYRKQARVIVRTRDRYGRIVGRTYCAGVDTSAEMVRRGAAWVYRRYNRDPRL